MDGAEPRGFAADHGAAGHSWGGSEAERGLDDVARRAARSSCTILLTGETGVGKGHLAKRLHAASGRARKPFVPVNCGAIPETIIDSQLFGHIRGAFSGATSDHLGLVRAAEGGTLFLDEIGELPASAQMRLLRLLQEHEVQPVGHSRPVIVDVRMIAATNGDLTRDVERGRFRQDLLFRLDVVRIAIPPLRERRDDVPALVALFNEEFSRLYAQPPLTLDPGALDLLRQHDWPGNIRQLRTVIERLHVLCPEERVTSAHVREIGLGERGAAAPVRGLDAIRAEEVERVLRINGGSVARTAAAFGVHRSTIYRWLQGRQPNGGGTGRT